MIHHPHDYRSHDRKAIDYYGKCRSHIEHEDGLVNQRLTWLLTLQGFMFTAYSFTLTAEATSMSSSQAIGTTAGQLARATFFQFRANLLHIRQGMVALGMLTSFASLCGVLAAFGAIHHEERVLRDQYRDRRKRLFPGVIGDGPYDRMGMISAVMVPFCTEIAWWLVFRHVAEPRRGLFDLCIDAILAISFGAVLYMVGKDLRKEHALRSAISAGLEKETPAPEAVTGARRGRVIP